MASLYSSSDVKSESREDKHDLELLARVQILQISNKIELCWKLI